MKILIIVAHPDDEVLGMGGTILKHVECGDSVFVCVVTKTYCPQWSEKYMETKVKEQKKVDEILGIRKRFNLDFPTVKLNTIPHGDLSKKISDVVNCVEPEIVYTHFWDDVNYDHSLIFRATMVATRPPKKIRLFCYETLSSTEWGQNVFKPTTWVNITKFIDKKIKALKVYKSEIKSYPHPRSIEGIRILAQKRGIEICEEYAEAFMLLRDIE